MFKTWHSPLNHGINCGRRNEQVVSQPFLFWFGLSSSSLDKFPFFLLSFFSFLLFIYLCICFSSSFLSFSLLPSLFFLQVPLSPLPPLLLPPPLFLPYHSIQFLTFLLVLFPLPPLPLFPPWVGENSAKRIIFYGQTKSLK